MHSIDSIDSIDTISSKKERLHLSLFWCFHVTPYYPIYAVSVPNTGDVTDIVRSSEFNVRSSAMSGGSDQVNSATWARPRQYGTMVADEPGSPFWTQMV